TAGRTRQAGAAPSSVPSGGRRRQRARCPESRRSPVVHNDAPESAIGLYEELRVLTVREVLVDAPARVEVAVNRVVAGLLYFLSRAIEGRPDVREKADAKFLIRDRKHRRASRHLQGARGDHRRRLGIE